jgi:tripartite-type tricarboxylate transporter receptor subunit TctC
MKETFMASHHRLLAGLLLAAAALPALCGAAQWPARPVQLIVGFSPGGWTDVLARALADSMAAPLGQPVVVVNRDGAGGTMAVAAAVSAQDGHTFFFGPAGAIVLQPHLKPTPYKPADLVGVCQTFLSNYALVAGAKSKYHTLQDVLNDPAAKTDGIAFGTGGLGSIPHLAAVQFGMKTGAKMKAVPYRGDPPMALALKSGEIELATVSVGLAQAQGFRILGVFAPARLADAPQAPTMTEQGVPVVAQPFGGIYASRNTPPQVLKALEHACQDGARSDHYLSAARNVQQEATFRGSAELTKATAAEYKTLGEVIRKADLKLR